MLRRNRGLLIFMATVAVLGIGLRLVWDVTSNRADPPIWVSILISLFVVAVAMGLESWDARRQARRARTHVEGPKPTNPDGTPFGYHQLRAGGWEFCDGCRKWGQGWTPEKPHQCPETYVHGPVAHGKATR